MTLTPLSKNLSISTQLQILHKTQMDKPPYGILFSILKRHYMADPKIREWIEGLILDIIEEDETLLLKIQHGDEEFRHLIKASVLESLLNIHKDNNE